MFSILYDVILFIPVSYTHLLSYSGISAKIRAMQSKLTTEEQFQEILQLSSVPQVITYLKHTKEYEEAWASLDENTLHLSLIHILLQALSHNIQHFLIYSI